MRYHGTGGQHARLDEPLTTATTKDRLALVTVTIQGTPYVIVDICLRMLRREELFRAQGFPADYIIDRTADGTKLSNSASVKMCGNSVSPPPLAALARANLEPADVPERLAA
jgi:DNA (cytosine-5)-methyltransferase 1